MSRTILLALTLLISCFSSWSWSNPSTEALQPGDVLYINFPGEKDFNRSFEVSLEGFVDLPEMGAFRVAGMDIAVANEKVKSLLGLLYRDIERMSIEIKQRNRLVQVLGYVKSPGTVTLTVRDNVQTAIEAAGGLLPGAQLDRLQVQRNGETSVFSYKDYLDSGDVSYLPALHSLDVVFVPASPLTGNVQIEFDAATLTANGDAADDAGSYRIFGEVKNPGRFSLEPNISIIDAIMRAGGVTRYAGVEQIKIISGTEPASFNLKRYLESGNEKLLPEINPGTTIFVPIQEEEIKTGTNVVYVMGEVFKPGAFESKEGAGLLDILANAGGPTRFAESRQIRILRADGEVTPFDLAAYTEGSAKGPLPEIAPGDAIFIPEKTDTNETSWLKVPPERAIKIIGQVYNPGRFEWSDEMSLLDLISHAEGPTARADIANIRVLSAEKEGDVETRLFNLDKFIRDGGDQRKLPVIKAGFTVVVPELPQDPSDNKAQWIRQSRDHSIYIMGQVGSPGRYMFNEEMSFLDILTAADGPKESADLRRIKIVHRNETGARMTELNLSLYFQTGDEALLPIVKPGDSIFVPEKDASWLDKPKEEMVRVIGAVNIPGRYAFTDEMNLLDLIAAAGGTSKSAYLDKVVVVNSTSNETRSTSFDMMAFMKSPDMNKLPVVRAGDTVFIPEKTDSDWRTFMEGVTDVFKIISVVGILGAL